MKKLLINLLLAVVLKGFTSATPGGCIKCVAIATVAKIEISTRDVLRANEETEDEIHPLDILAFKFN